MPSNYHATLILLRYISIFMRGGKVWVFVWPREIPESVRNSLKERIEKHAQIKWSRTCSGVIIRFRGKFAYVDAIEAVSRTKSYKQNRSETIPTHLCRMRYLGDINKWEFAFYKYSDECYELCYLDSGKFEGTPEECFDCAARAYLG